MAIVAFLVIEAWSEFIELKPAVVYLIVTLGYLHQQYEYVSKRVRRWEKAQQKIRRLEREIAGEKTPIFDHGISVNSK